MVSGEYISQLSEFGPPHPKHHEQRTRLPDTLGDARAALRLERAPQVLVASNWPTGSPPLPTTADLCLAYPKGHDPGTRMLTKSRAIRCAAISNTPLLMHEVLEAAGISMRDIDHVITHQTSARQPGKTFAIGVWLRISTRQSACALGGTRLAG